MTRPPVPTPRSPLAPSRATAVPTRLRPHRTAGTRPRWSYATSLEATPGSASLARDFVSCHLADRALPALVEPVRLVVSELVTNALLHARTAISVTLSATDTTVLLSVRDQSPTLPRRRTARTVDETGRGLQLVDAVSLDWGISPGAGSKEVWACFARDVARRP